MSCPYDIAVLVDSKLQKDDRFYIGAVEGQGSVQLDASHLMDCLAQDGTHCKPHYVDFEAEVKVGKDAPPDLQHILENIQSVDISGIVSDSVTVSPTAQELATSAAGNSAIKKKQQQHKKNENKAILATSLDIKSLTNTILELSHEHHSCEDEETRRRTRADIAMKLNALRNAAYASGYAAS